MASLLAAGASLHDVEYARAGDMSLRMDAHIPDGPGPFPAAIIVHGGGWVSGDRKLNVEPLFTPLQNAGFAWFSISYRLAGQMPAFGAAVDDVTNAVRHVRAHADQYRIDPDRLALIGESAGAQLASMAAISPDLSGAIKGVVAFYSPSDLVTLARTSQYIPDHIRRALEASPFAAVLGAALQQYSPLNHVRPGMPPFLLIHGTADRLVPFEQSQQMCSRMQAVGASCEIYAVEDAGHGLRWWEGSRNTSYKAQMIRWLREHTQSSRM